MSSNSVPQPNSSFEIDDHKLLKMVDRKGALGTLNLAKKEHNAFIGQDVDFLKQVVGQVAVALDNAHREIAELKDKLAKGKTLSGRRNPL